jgi:hypothetical protein
VGKESRATKTVTCPLCKDKVTGDAKMWKFHIEKCKVEYNSRISLALKEAKEKANGA